MEPKPKRERKPRKPKQSLFDIGFEQLKKRGVGQPPKFTSAEELGVKIGEYIHWENQREQTRKGKYTMHGLAVYLGFTSRQSLYDSEARDPEMKQVIDLFRMFVIAFNEGMLYGMHTARGAEFFLKCWCPDLYKDEVTQNVHTVTSVSPQVVMGDAPPLANSESDVTV